MKTNPCYSQTLYVVCFCLFGVCVLMIIMKESNPRILVFLESTLLLEEKGPGEMAQWQRALTAFPDVLGLLLSSHLVAHNFL